MSKYIYVFPSFIFLVLNLVTLSDYGYTWDYPHHYNAGIKRLTHIMHWDLSWLPYQDPITFGDQPYGPLADALPVLSQIIFHYRLQFLPADSAYHLPLIFASFVGIFALSRWLSRHYTPLTGFFAGMTIAFYPRWVGHAHNNPKDTLSAVFFALATMSAYKFFTAITRNNPNTIQIKQLLTATTCWALAFNMKVNAVLLFPIIFIWLSFLALSKSSNRWISILAQCKQFFLYLTFSLIFALSIWSAFWNNPLFHLKDLVRHFSTGTTGFPILYYGQIYQANINVPWHYAFGYLAAVTPTLVIIFFILGTFTLAQQAAKSTHPASSLILIWFLVPTLKYIYPKIGLLDDIRHYLEVVFPLSAISAIGISKFFSYLQRQLPQANPLITILTASLCLYLIWPTISHHPYQTSYYSEWLGSLTRVHSQNLFDIEFWGHSLKKASTIVNQTAPPNSIIWVPMAQQVAREYIRPDLVITQSYIPDAQYLMVFNRLSMLKTRFGLDQDVYAISTSLTPSWEYRLFDTPIIAIYPLK